MELGFIIFQRVWTSQKSDLAQTELELFGSFISFGENWKHTLLKYNRATRNVFEAWEQKILQWEKS